MPFVASTSVVLLKTVAGDSVSQSLYHLVFYSFILLDSGVLSYSISLCSHRIDNRKLSPWLSSDWHKLSILDHSSLILTCTPLITLCEVFVAWETFKAISLLVSLRQTLRLSLLCHPAGSSLHLVQSGWDVN